MRALLVILGFGLIGVGIYGMASGLNFNFGSDFQNVINSAVEGPSAEDLCKPGETLEQETGASVYTPGQGYGSSVTYHCVDNKGARRDVTGDFAQNLIGDVTGNLFSTMNIRWEFVGLIGLGILLVVVAIISGILRAIRVPVATSVIIPPSGQYPSGTFGLGGQSSTSAQFFQQAAATPPASGDDLVNKLNQLEEAFKANLISQEEHDRLRQQILDSLK